MKNNWVKACISMTVRSLILGIWIYSAAVFASKGSGQSIHKVYISVDLKEVTVAASLTEIEHKTDFTFFYGQELFKDIEQKVTVNADNRSVADILEQITKATGLTFRQINGTIAVKREIFPQPGGEPKESITGPQQHQLNGTVTDSKGIPLPGVNIIIKGTSTGTISDYDGHYAIRVRDTDVLLYSYIGYETVEEHVNGRTVINIKLHGDVTELQEVEVNAGYWTVKERERTGNISRVTAEEIEMQPVINPLQALQGRMTGVDVRQTSGIPGAAATIRIRGQNSLRPEGNLPLYIIDGVPVNSNTIPSIGGLLAVREIDPLNTINLSNIESIEVLKDADATAIYGSRGANGIVLITTKKGKEGKTTLDINMYSGAGKVSNTMKLLNTEQYLEMRKEAFTNDGVQPGFADYDVNGTWDQDRYTNWQKELIGGTAFITDLQATLSGGNSNTSFQFGGAYHKEGTVFPGDFDYQKVTGHFNLNHITTDKRFQATLSVNYGIDKNSLFDHIGLVNDAIILPPNAPALYNEMGELNWENSTWTNPLSNLRKTQDITSNNIVTNAVLSYQVLPGLNLKTNLGYTNLHSEETIKIPKSSSDPAFQEFVLNQSGHLTAKRQSWIIEPQAVYSYKIGDGHLDALLGVTFQESSSNTLRILAAGYVQESLIGNLPAAENILITGQQDAEYKYNAVFGRIGYNWKEKYYINLTGRRDGSSRFGPNNRFANFGAIGGAWIFSEESFIKDNVPFISFGKLRGSYGTTGNDQIGDYGYLDTYTPTGFGGLYPTQLTNPDYSWEINKKLEIALELGFIENRIQLSASWYRNRSSNQLVGQFLPAITGFTSVQANLPATVQNTGWELEVNTRNIQSDEFSWRTSFNISFPKNKLVEFSNIENTAYANTYRVGKPLSSAILFQSTGVNPETGLYEVVDANNDGVYTFDDRIVVKDLGRQYFGGINNSINYKNFGIDFFFEFVKQPGKNHFMFSPPGFSFAGNQPVEVLERWQQTGDITDIQKFTQSFSIFSGYFNAVESDLSISDASFIRLKTLSLSYQIPSEFLTKTGLNACKVYLHGQNLFTWTNYIGLDPQLPGDIRTLPVLRTVTGGIQLKF